MVMTVVVVIIDGVISLLESLANLKPLLDVRCLIFSRRYMICRLL